MNQQNQLRFSGQSSPRLDRNLRSKSRIGLNRQSRPIYLTDGQFSSSDHTNISSSEINIFRIEYQSRIKKLEKENKQLKQTIVSLKATQFYQVDQQKIKIVIRQNEFLKLRINELDSDMKLLDQEVSSLMVENQYLKRNNKALKQDLQREIKQSIREKHNYYTPSNNGINSKKSSNAPITYGDQNYEQSIQLKHESKQRQKQQRNQLDKLLSKKKGLLNQLHKEKEKNLENIQSNESEDKSKKFRMRNKSRYRSNSKSGQKALINSFMGSKALLKKPKKQIEIPSTAQSQGLKHYSSSGNLLNLRSESRNREIKIPIPTARSPNAQQLVNQYAARRKNDEMQSPDYNGQYFATKRQKYANSKKKKSLYYN